MVRTDFNQQYTIAVGKRIQHKSNSTLICTEVTGHLKGEGQNKEENEQGLSRVREVNNYKKQQWGRVGLCEIHEFVNWHLSKLGSWSPTVAGRQAPNLQLLAGTNSKFFWKP